MDIFLRVVKRGNVLMTMNTGHVDEEKNSEGEINLKCQVKAGHQSEDKARQS